MSHPARTIGCRGHGGDPSAYGDDAAERCTPPSSRPRAGDPLAPGHRGGAVQPRRRGHPAAARLRRARARSPARASGSPRSRSSPPTGWPSCSAPSALAGAGQAAGVHAGARRGDAGRAGRRRRAVRARRRAPGHRGRARRHLPGAARPLPRRARRARRAPATGPPRSCGSTAPSGPASSRRGTTSRTCSRGRGRCADPGRVRPSSARSSSTSPSASRCTAPASCAALAEHVPTTVDRRRSPAMPAADAEVLRVARAASGVDAPAPDGAGDPPPGRRRSAPRSLTASDADEEVRAAVRAVVDAVRAGTPLDRIAVLHASPEPYARLAHEHLHAAGIATNGAAVVPLAARVAGRTLLELLGAARRRLPPPGRVRLARVGADPPRRAAGRPPRRGSGCRARRPSSPAATTGTTASRSSPRGTSERARRPSRRTTSSPSGWPSAARASAAAGPRAPRVRARRRSTTSPRPRPEPRRWSEHAAWAAARGSHRLLGGAARRDGWPDRPSARRPSGSSGARPARRARRRRGRRSASTCSPARSSSSSSTTSGGSAASATACSSARSRWASASTSTSSSCSAWPRARSRPPCATTRSSPTTSAPAAGGELAAAAPTGSSASTASSSPRWPARARQRALRPPRRPAPQRRAGAVALGARPRRRARRRRRPLVGRRPARAAREPWVRARRRRSTPGCAHARRPGHRAGAPAPRPARRRRRPRAPPTTPRTALRRRGHRRPPQRRASPASTATSPGSPSRRRSTAITSPTRLERWADCPHRLPRARTSSAPRRSRTPRTRCMITPLDKGNLVHEALERFLLEVLARPAGRPARPGRAVDAPPTATCSPQIGARAAATSTRRAGSPAGRSSGAATAAGSSPTSSRFLAEDSDHRVDARHRARSPPSSRSASTAATRRRSRVALPDGRALRVPGQGRPGRRRRRRHASTSSTTRPARPTATSGLDRGRPDRRAAPSSSSPVYGLAGRGATAASPTPPVRAEYWFVTDRRASSRRIGLRRSPTTCSSARSARRSALIVARHRGRRVPAPPDRDCRTSSSGSRATSATPTASAPPSCASSGSASATTPRCAATPSWPSRSTSATTRSRHDA